LSQGDPNSITLEPSSILYCGSNIAVGAKTTKERGTECSGMERDEQKQIQGKIIKIEVSKIKIIRI
jgi:hypothetical protein